MPVKSEITNDQTITLNTYMSTTILMKISMNYLILNDEWVTNLMSPKNISYVDFRFAMTSIGMPDATPYEPLHKIMFTFDENMLIYERKLVTLPDIIAQTGGLMGIIISGASIIVGWL